MRIAQVSSEVAPFAKTGGLGDVCAALPRYLAEAGHDVRVFLPLYRDLKVRPDPLVPVGYAQGVPIAMGRDVHTFSLFTGFLPDTRLPIYFVSCPTLYDRPGTYTADGDEHVRFGFLARAAIESCQRMAFAPDVFHAHDWHAALVPLYLKTRYAWDSLFARTKTVLTIHNAGYQGTVSPQALDELGLADDTHLLHQGDLARGRFSFLVTGILHAHALTTVSRTYAREMMTEEYGMGLDGLLRARAASFTGIVNGIDPKVWSPEVDPHIHARYSASDLSGKEVCKRGLSLQAGFQDDPGSPILGIVSRMTAQKGFDLAFDVLPRALRNTDLRLVVLGSGEPRLVDFFLGLERRFPGRVRVREGYDEPLAHKIEAGSDLFLMPSHFEPCGLNQMYSMRYGTPPVVRKTGGLADTVSHFDRRTGEGTGFVFEHATADGLEWGLARALETWRDRPAWARLVRNAMAQDWSWTRQIREYEALYASL